MTDTSKCFSLIRGRAMRVTKLDACGNLVLGPKSQSVSDGFVSIAFTANTEEGEAISVTNAAGNVCVSDTPAPKFTGWGITASFCGVNPDMYSHMTGQPVVMDGAEEFATGLRINDDVDLDGQGFALEVWSSVPTSVCGASGLPGFGYLLIPFVKGGVLGDFTVENAAVNFTIQGAQSKSGTPWGVGPYDVTRDEADVAGPLNVAVPTSNHLHMELVTVEPPTSVCGALPVGTLATTATAGIPATLGANKYAPNDFASIGALAASPSTAWTTGQYVLLLDGTKAHWNGTAWATGPA